MAIEPENQLGLGLTLVGAGAMAISAFLPLYQPTGLFRVIQDNSLIQTSGGWLLLAAAGSIAAGGFWASRGSRGKLALPITVCVLCGLVLIWIASSREFRTLYPVRPGGGPDATQEGTVTSLGIGVYVAGAGVAFALVGLLVMVRETTSVSATPAIPSTNQVPVQGGIGLSPGVTKKKCPDCAETILVDAKVCKHCGFRFPTSNVKCHRCQHVQNVLTQVSTFSCEGCGANLQRKSRAG